MSARRGLLLAALLCAAGAGLVLLAAGRRWAGVEIVGAGTPIVRALTGHDLAAPATALGWAGLGGLAALLAVRGRARTAVGAALVAFGAGAGYSSAAGVGRAHVLSVAADKSNLSAFLSTDVHTGGWWWGVSVAGGALLVASGLLTIVRGRRWPGMSARYDAARGGGPATADHREPDDPGGHAAASAPPAAKPPPAATDPARLWQAIDRGEDPTARGGTDRGTDRGGTDRGGASTGSGGRRRDR
ncbi:MAG TPA: Trp biosynthesis-associated membrane protein [Streptosporangiaceae bacterium]|nr:Trp biosynthesis-associated membrane protein [Streptosporangiaceae bacterium]